MIGFRMFALIIVLEKDMKGNTKIIEEEIRDLHKTLLKK